MAILDKKEQPEVTFSMSVNRTLEKFRKVFLVALIALIAITIFIIVGLVVNSNSEKIGIQKIDTIEFTLLNNNSELLGDELKKTQDSAIEQLVELSNSRGIVGVRASMLLADLYFQQEKFLESKNVWIHSADLKKNSYTNPVAYYNAAVCSEKLNDIDSAIELYKKASEYSDFILIDHVLFSLGRIYEEKNDFESAISSYQKLNDVHPDSSWAKLAKSRIISNKIAGNK